MVTRREAWAIDTVPCDYCGALIGNPCFNITGGAVRPSRNYPHQQRVKKADKVMMESKKRPIVVHFGPARNVPRTYLYQGRLQTLLEDTELDELSNPDALIGKRVTISTKGIEVEDTVASRKRALDRQLDRIMDEIDKLEAIGEDVYEDETVLLFRIKHNEYDEKAYDYVAFKAGDRWYMTGYQNEGPLSWDRMVEKFSHGTLEEMWVITGWEQIV